MHRHEVGIVLDSGEGALDVVVSCVPIVIGVGNGQIPLPFQETIKRLREVKSWFVFLVCPVVDGERVWERSKTAVGNRSWFSSMMHHIDESLRS